jgi:hypothetical protein
VAAGDCSLSGNGAFPSIPKGLKGGPTEAESRVAAVSKNGSRS